jgi:hypothetical protein
MLDSNFFLFQQNVGNLDQSEIRQIYPNLPRETVMKIASLILLQIYRSNRIFLNINKT